MTRLIESISPFPLVAVLILILVGGPFLGIGLYNAAQSQHILNTFKSASGVVIDNDYSSSSDDSSGAYYPVVEFKPEDGRPVRFTDGVGTLPPDYEAGTPVEVLYNPQDVTEAYINSWKRMWLVAVLFSSIGAVPIAISVLMIARPFFKTGRGKR